MGKIKVAGTVFLVCATAVVCAPGALAATPWTAAGSASSTGGSVGGFPTVASDGTTRPAEMQYAYQDSPGASASGSWTFKTTASSPGTRTIAWRYSGFHAYFQVTVGLVAYVSSGGSDTFTQTLVSAGPTDCCTPPSSGFSYSGVTTFTFGAGDDYGFRLAGSNGDSDERLNGTLKLGYTVDKWADTSGEACDDFAADDCSLRDAIGHANASAGTDVINFEIPGFGAQTITPASPLPAITGPVSMDATTQPGFVGMPRIRLDGASAGLTANGLYITGGGSIVRGLAITRFDFDGIRLETGDANTIVGNWIGLDTSGIAAGNHGYGVDIRLASAANTVGGAGADANVISANGAGSSAPSGPFAGLGIFDPGTTGNVIQGNFIGTDTTGSSATGYGNAFAGILMRDASGNSIGIPLVGNVISGNAGAGVLLDHETGDSLSANRIGTNAAGTATRGNIGAGVSITNGSTTIAVGGTNPGQGNIISGNGAGVDLASSSAATVAGNLIGTNAAGTADLGNVGWGVSVGSAGNTVGGTTAAARNVISGNDGGGVLLSAAGSDLFGNYIGTNAAGTAAIGNIDSAGNIAFGVYVAASGAVVGGTDPGEGNVISGNAVVGPLNGRGVEVPGGVANARIEGNLIGTNAAGTAAIPNNRGIEIAGGTTSVIGGSTAGARNVISGNVYGISFSGTGGNVVKGNYIGTTSAGTGAVGNTGLGLNIFSGTSNTIGGTGAGDGNVISGNGSGVLIQASASGNVIQGNRIGLQATANAALGNSGYGIQLATGTSNTVIGGVAAGAANTIATNGGDGIWISGGQGNAVRRNAIYGNGELGIDLDADGVSLNDAPPDGDTGANNIQNFPVIAAANGGSITGTLHSTPSMTFAVDIFANTTCDGSGFGEGQRYIGSAPVSTDGTGAASFSIIASFSTGEAISATATDPSGNTSELAGCTIATGTQPIAVDNTGDTSGDPCTAAAGDCSLRSAIQKANAQPGNDKIIFLLPVPGVQTITPGSDLPPLTDPVTIDGTTQTGFTGAPLIVLDGSAPSNPTTGLELAAGADGSTLRGLVIGNFDDTGILLGSDGNTIAGSYIGVNATGAAATPNGIGISALPASDGNTIGGAGPLGRNVISGNVQYGIELASGSGEESDLDTVIGNYIGTNAAGTGALGNGFDGILASGGSTITIGGTAAGERNVVSGNGAMGLRFDDVKDLRVEGNYVGVDATGNAKLGNNSYGINLRSSTDAVIGGTVAAARNVIGGNDAGMYLEFNDGAVVQGNYIGLGANGVADVGNVDPATAGIAIDQASSVPGATPTLIGGTVAAARNHITFNSRGIALFEADTGTTIQGNWIGVDATGARAANVGDGVYVWGTNGTLIGGATTSARNVIAGPGGCCSTGASVKVTNGSLGTMIQGNYISTNPAGTAENWGNRVGVLVEDGSSATAIGGTAGVAADPPGNLFGSDADAEIHIDGTNGNVIRGNSFGFEAGFTDRLTGGGPAILIDNAAQNNVVGNDTGSGSDYNVIGFSGDESEPGVLIDGSNTDQNKVVGNRIGTFPDGATDAPNDVGVVITAAAKENTVGGPGPLGNLISANGTGVLIAGSANLNEVQGNRIGTTLDGTAALGNGDGVRIDGGHSNLIGGIGAGTGNLISGNSFAGVLMDGNATAVNAVKGNSIGVAADLTTPLPNDIGVQISNDALNATVGLGPGDPPAAGNLIANSDDANVLIINNADANDIAGNTVKDSASDGIRILNSSDNNHLWQNTVTGNGENGVRIGDGTGNKLIENLIDLNADLGIDLGPPGVTPNDLTSDCSGTGHDCDSGANDGQNFPDVTVANIDAGLLVEGVINSNALDGSNPASYTIEVFASPACDLSGNGEGATLVGSTVILVDGTGHGTWSVSDSGSTVTPGEVVTATATDATGNSSEFSGCQTVTAVSTPLAATIDLSQDSADVRAGAQSVPIGGIDLATLTRGAGPTTASSPLDGIPLEGIAIAGSPLEGIPLEGIGLTPQNLNQALGGVHLSDIPLTPPASWTQLLAGTPLANVPLATLTLADVLALPSPPTSSITLGTISLHSTPLEGIGLGGIALGPKLLSAVPLEGIGQTPAQNLQDWCDAINAQAGYSCAGPTTLANETVMGQVLRGVPLEGIPLDGIPLEGIDLSGTPLEGIPLEGIDLSSTPLEGIPLEGINMAVSPLEGIPLEGINILGSPLEGIPLEGIPTAGLNLAIDCSAGFCLANAGNTLGDAVTASRIKLGAKLGMLDGGYGTVTLDNLVDALKAGSGLSLSDLVPGLPAGHTLHDLLAAMLGASSYDWSTLNLNTFPIADFSSDGGVAQYHAEFEVTGGALLTVPVTIHATLPAGGRYIPNTSVLTTGGPPLPLANPVLGAGGQLSWSFNVLRDQQYTISWQAKPGLDLGSSAVGANIQLSNGTTLATPVNTRVIQTFNATNLPNGDTNDDPATAPTLAGNSLYVSHLTKGDTDYYRIPIGAYGSTVEVTLSHIPDGSDYDLAIAGPPAPRLRTAPANAIPLGNQQLQDTSVDLNHRDQPLPPEALQDVPTGQLASSGRVVRAVADNRGSAPERLTLLSQGEAGFYTIQITDYQGDSPDPYLLEVKTIPPPGFGPCAPRSIANSTAAGPPSVTAATQTLFLVNERRLIATFGTSATSTLLTKLGTLAGRSDVAGSIVRVETGAGVPAAYTAWDATPCSPEQANNVVRTIGSYLDTLLASGPNVKYVVVVGGDDIVPFARVPDNTEIANERTYRESLGQSANQFLGSIGAGFLLTDDVWGEKAAPDFLGNELFVPELAVGRLVESPTDMGKTIDGYIAANGLLAPTSSLVTGYDFLTDGATSINVPFAAGLGTNAKTLINDAWDRNQLLAQLFPAGGGGPKLNSLNAHFDHQRLLPAAENAANRQSNLVTTGDITAAMSGRLGFSIGCHSGLAVSDAVFGAANLLSSDWAQAMLGQGAAGWIGNTGYGLGDTTDVAYSERLHALFSRKLDGTLTVGQALEQAKQDYLGTLAVMSPYDAKVMMEATLYGLPMLKLGSGIPASPPPPPPLHTDPTTGLQAASFDVSPTFTRVTTANGKYDRADSGIQSTPRRPLEPLVSLDVTQPGGLVAHGALINLLNSPAADETNFDAIFSQVTTDQAADDPTLAGVNAFPSKIQSVATFSSLTTQRQRLNLVVGLFRSDGPTLAGIGTHRRYTRVAGDTLYSTSTDWLEPELRELQTLRVGTLGAIGFSTTVTDPTATGAGALVKTVKVLYRDCNGTWRTATLLPATGNRWAGSGTVAPAGCLNIDYYLEAADGAGNVAVSSKKVQLEPLVAPPDVVPPDASPITHTLNPASPTASGWYAGSVQVTLSSGDPVRYSLDGATPLQNYTAPFMVTGDGPHIVEASTEKGATHTFGFAVDATGPLVTITRTPGTPDVNGWYTFSVNEQVSAQDPGGSDVQQIRCVLDPPGAPPTLFSQLPASCPYLAGGNITSEGVHKLYAAATDAAGNAGAVVSDTFGIDKTAATTTMGALSPFQTAATFSPTWSGFDAGSGVKNFDIRYRQAASSSSTFGGYTAWQSATPALTAAFTGTAGATTCFSGRARDNAGWLPFAYSAEVCSTVPLDDAALTRSGFWSTTSAADLYGGSASRSTSTGSTLTSPTMVGSQIGVLVTKQPGGGTIQLRWNGITKVTQSLSAASRQPKQLLTFSLGSVQSGTLQVYVSASGTVDIDGAGAFKTP